MIVPNQYLGSLVVVLALLLGACSQQAPPDTAPVDIDSSSVQIVTSKPRKFGSGVHIQQGARLGHRR